MLRMSSEQAKRLSKSLRENLTIRTSGYGLHREMSSVHLCTLHPLSNQLEVSVELNSTALAKFETEAKLSAIDC